MVEVKMKKFSVERSGGAEVENSRSRVNVISRGAAEK